MGGTWHVELGLLGAVVGVGATGAVQVARALFSSRVRSRSVPLCVDPWAAPAVAAAAAAGVFLAVPDTEAATMALGFAVAMTGAVIIANAAGRQWRVDAVMPFGALLIVWAASSGTAGPNVTNAALIGAIATSAVMVLAPAVRWVRRRRLGPGQWSAGALVAMALSSAVVVARIGAVRSTLGRAVAVSLAVWVATAVGLWFTARPSPGETPDVNEPVRPSP